MEDIILGIESSCDDTSAAVIKDGYLLSNVLASQDVHKAYGGVIPELASRAHQLNIVPVVSQAIDRAGIRPSDITAIAFTRGPGLLGSLLVGTSFAKGLAVALDRPLIEVNHLQGHILANFIKQYESENRHPSFPYLRLLVSGGNSQIVRVDSPLEFEILGQTIDDAVGEAFDKCSKMMGLGYPGGPVVDISALFCQGQDSRRSGFHGEEQGGYLCRIPEDAYRNPYGQAGQGGEADGNKGSDNGRRSLCQQRAAQCSDRRRQEEGMECVSA